MKLWQMLAWVGAGGGLLLLASGCASPDVNPKSARSGRGYVDLYTVPKSDVWWKVDVFLKQEQTFKEFTVEFKAPDQDILRVEARPGWHKARIAFVNAVVEAPAEIDVEVREGMITPIRVAMEPAGTTFTQSREDRVRWEESRVKTYDQQVWKISATAGAPVPFAPKESTAYWK